MGKLSARRLIPCFVMQLFAYLSLLLLLLLCGELAWLRSDAAGEQVRWAKTRADDAYSDTPRADRGTLKRPLRAQTVVPAVVESSSGPLLAKLYPADDESSPLPSNTRGHAIARVLVQSG